jgi:hypothetical protein
MSISFERDPICGGGSIFAPMEFAGTTIRDARHALRNRGGYHPVPDTGARRFAMTRDNWWLAISIAWFFVLLATLIYVAFA